MPVPSSITSTETVDSGDLFLVLFRNNSTISVVSWLDIHQAIGCPKSSHIYGVLILLYKQLYAIIIIIIVNIIITLS